MIHSETIMFRFLLKYFSIVFIMHLKLPREWLFYSSKAIRANILWEILVELSCSSCMVARNEVDSRWQEWLLILHIQDGKGKGWYLILQLFEHPVGHISANFDNYKEYRLLFSLGLRLRFLFIDSTNPLP